NNRQTSADILGIKGNGHFTFPGGGEILFDGNVIGTIQAGTGTNDLVINFTTSYATPVAIQELIRAIYYHNTSASLSTATRTVAITVNDGGGQTSAISNVTILVVGPNVASFVTTWKTTTANESILIPTSTVI